MAWKEVFAKAFYIIDFVLGFLKVKWWNEFKEAITEGFQQAIELAELAYEHSQNEGAKKKELAAQALAGYLQDRGILDFIPVNWLAWLLDRAFDILISYLNKQFGHDWFKKLFPA